MSTFVMDKRALGGARRKGRLNYPMVFLSESDSTVTCSGTSRMETFDNLPAEHRLYLRLNRRQTTVLTIILRITNNGVTQRTYQDVKMALGENPAHCRGIGATCRALYDRGYTDINNLIVGKRG